MALDPTIEVLGHSNLKTTAEAGSWSNAQKQMLITAASDRTDRYSDLALGNAVHGQNLANQSALDHLNISRSINTMFLASMANKLISMDVDQAIATSAALKGGADASLMTVLGQLAGAQIGGKIANTTPPETGVTQLFAQLNALTQQNQSNQGAIGAQVLAGFNAMNQTQMSTNAALTAVAGIIGKIFDRFPPEGSSK